ncbi:Uncharacterised protein [Streptococcus dysgalactiae]|nr:Uncharacterised protein [Streptococcus dysgalactiae]
MSNLKDVIEYIGHDIGEIKDKTIFIVVYQPSVWVISEL